MTMNEPLPTETEDLREAFEERAGILEYDGTPYVDEPLPPGSRVIEIVITDPPNRPPWTNPRVEAQVLH